MDTAGIYTYIYIILKHIRQMNINNCYCVIMAGGSGTRFWPVSRASKPKQFLDITDTGRTFIQQTFDRFARIVPQDNILVVTAEKYKDLVLEQLPLLKEENLLLEPYARNTAPCIAYATYKLLQRNPDANVVVTPSDHAIYNEDLFTDTILKAFEWVEQNDVLMTLGVVPTRPDTNYGYVQACGGKKAFESNVPVPVKTFTEKPDRDMASLFISTGEFFWNAGIFVWKAKTICSELEKHLPDITGLFEGWERALGTKVENDFILKAFTDCRNISIDYGVMEKTDRAWIFPVRFGWSDIGTWESLYNVSGKDDRGNAINVKTSLVRDSKNILAVSTDKKKMIAVKGLDDYMIIDTEDALIVCPKDDKQFKDFISGIAMPEYEKYR